MATVKTVLVKGRCYKDGGYPLVIQVIHRRKKRVIYLGYSISSEMFNPAREVVVSTSSSNLSLGAIRKINKECNAVKQLLSDVIASLERKNKVFDVDDIMKLYHQNINGVGFYQFFEHKIEELKDLGKFGTARAYASTLKSILTHMGSKELSFSQISIDFIRTYRNRLSMSKVSSNTIGFYLHNMKAVYRKGCKEFSIDCESPFLYVDIRVEKTKKRSLNRDVIKQIALLDLSGSKQLKMARDLFMFSFYTRGMSFVDIVMLKKTNIESGVICYKRHKTNQLMQVELISQTKEILADYENTTPYLFPLLVDGTPGQIYASYRKQYDKMRYSLKKIAKMIGIQVPLTAYVARHSWAMIAKESGASTVVISECLGHRSETMTHVYLRELDRSVLDSLNNIVAEMIF